MYHHMVDALIQTGLHDKAFKLIQDYWGGMANKGATTFWEVFNPTDDQLSPYGYAALNSYCHAWSCTPSYFIRRHKW